jgi:hypothetical protein
VRCVALRGCFMCEEGLEKGLAEKKLSEVGTISEGTRKRLKALNAF